jgi:F-type H+-transporting ATPase subunit delta
MKITSKQLAQTLYALTDGKSRSEIEKSVTDFAHYIHRERKLALTDKIIEQFSKIYNGQKGIIEAEVVSMSKLEGSQVHKVKSFVKEKYQAKEVVLKNVVDGNIKGGMIIRVGDEVVDGSVAGRLEELKKKLAQET